MRVRMRSTYANSSGLTANPGDVIDVDVDTAQELITGGHAARVADDVDQDDEDTDGTPRRGRRQGRATSNRQGRPGRNRAANDDEE